MKSLRRGLWLVSAVAVLGAAVGCSGSDGAAGAAGAQGPAGPKGDPGPAGPAGPAGTGGGGAASTPSLSAVTPSSAMIGRTLDVTISGYATSFTDKTTVDFGADVTVNHVTVASPTALVANVTVKDTAKVGALDVKVKDAVALTYKGAFQVVSPIGLTVDGTVAQGSIALVHVVNHDFTTPFDATTDGNFFNPSYTNIQIPQPAGLATQVLSVDAYSLTYAVLADVDAPAGSVDTTIESGPNGAQVAFPYPASYSVEKRDPVALVDGQASSAKVAKAYESGLYQYAPGASLATLDIDVTAADPNASPKVWILPKSGHFADALGAATTTTLLTSSAAPLYFIYFDGSGIAGYTYHVKATSTAVTAGAEKEPNDTLATANAVGALPWVAKDATLASMADEDWFAVKLEGGAVGKTLVAATLAGDPLTDTIVEIVDKDGTSLAKSDDSTYLDAATIDVKAAGTVYVHVTASTYFDPSHDTYSLLVRLQ
jgi:hypothetical protein